MTRKAAIAKINNLSTKSFNTEQKQLAIKMLEKAPLEELDQWLSFILQRVTLGFTFDFAPEPDLQKIVLAEENQELSLIEKNNQLTHKLIIGENFEGLKNLLVTHRNAIDIIYIDPPYNTEAASSEGNNKYSSTGEYQREKDVQIPSNGKFVYRDKFSRTGWLNLLNERLKLARDLLTEHGVIFVSIDDNEQAYLKVLMDEIFGENNFICNFIWEKTRSTKNDSMFASINHDYILCYRKSQNFTSFNRGDRTEDLDKKYKHDNNDGKGRFMKDNLTAATSNYRYSVKIKGKTFNPPANRNWSIPEWKMYQWIEEGKIHVPSDPKQRLTIKRYLNEVSGIVTKTILKNCGNTTENQRNLNEILNKQVFRYPKGIKLLKYLIKLIPNNERATILDFFAGSGTTLHATMDLNREDKGKRECILITNNENKIAYDITYERLHRIIKRKGTKGETDFLWLNKQINYTKNNLQVFELKEYDVSLKQINNLDKLLKHAKMQFQKLNPTLKLDEDTLLSKLQYLYPVLKDD